MAPTAASRPGGKFANLSSTPSVNINSNPNTTSVSNSSDAPPGSSQHHTKPKQPRGKFANLVPPAPTSSTSLSNVGTTNNTLLGPSYEDVRSNETHQKKIQLLKAMKRNTQVLSQKKQVFADCDHAENLVLELISLASDSADALSHLTNRTIDDSLVVKEKRKIRENDLMVSTSTSTEDDSESEDQIGTHTHTRLENATSISGEQKKSKLSSDIMHAHTPKKKTHSERNTKELSKHIQHNGKRYQDTLQKIHKLLSPHAHLVVPYGSTNKKTVVPSKNSTSISPAAMVSATSISSTRNDDSSTTIVPSALSSTSSLTQNNMYIARLEKRLVHERKDLLLQMIRLEKEGGVATAEEENEQSESIDNHASQNQHQKRKRDE